MNILFFDFGSYMAPDWIAALQKQGHRVKTLYRNIGGQDYYHNEALETMLEKELHEHDYDALLSSNFFPAIGFVCHAHGIKYLSWCYDAPMNLPHEEGFDLPGNYIFLFDRGDYLRYKRKGLDTVYHLPLAVNSERLSRTAIYDPAFACDISMLGQLYESTLPALKSQMPEFDKGYLDALVRVQTDLYGTWLTDDLITQERVDVVNAHYRELSDTAIQITAAQLSYAVATHITHINRVSLLRVLASRFDVFLCSGSVQEGELALLAQVKLHGRVSYTEEMPRLFASSKINLNATLRCIQTGIPLRALDICGCGGFLLSNYQEELAECFVPGKEIVLYESVADAPEKATYYLQHEEERKRIAENGHARVQSDFRYEDRIDTMFQTAGLQ